MSAATIQDMIDSVPRDLSNYTLTFQFGDGTYTLTAPLTFYGFRTGTMYIQGNSGESLVEHTNQAVALDFSSGNCFGIMVARSSTTCYVENLKVTVASAAASASNTAISINSTLNGLVIACYCLGTATDKGIAIGFSYCYGLCNQNYVSNINVGVRCYTAIIMTSVNDDTGTMPIYGISAQAGGRIGKNSTQPDGSTADEQVLTGGEIA
jgi:hypothetical protein